LKYFTFPALALACALTACGGGGGDSPAAPARTAATATSTTTVTPSTPTPPSAPPLASVSQVIEYYGDSTIWGWATGSNGVQVNKPAPLAFAEAFPASPHQEVRNEGVSGTTACTLLTGDGKHAEWNGQMANSTATAVIINHAINDAKPGTGESVSAYKACLLSLVQIAKAKGKRVILETPNPVSGFTGLENYVAAMKDVAAQEQVSLIDQFKYLTDYLNGRDTAEITPDGLHPTNDVYIMKGKFAESVFMTFTQ
jgi:lysophospholipase L1-like esterase